MSITTTTKNLDPENTRYFLLTVDVEDWFQVENFKPWIPFSTWDSRDLRVERNVHRLLDLFDSVELDVQVNAGRGEGPESFRRRRIGADQFHPEMDPSKKKSKKSCKSCQNKEIKTNPFLKLDGLPSLPASQHQAERRPKATFFVLGWLAERLPHLVREIQSRGHEVASHGCNHGLPNTLSPKDLKNDLTDSKKLLEDTIGQPINGYRAPSFAVNDDILKTISDCGYQYDSSYNSFSLHGRYGQISLNGAGKKGIAHKIDDNFYELPISNLKLVGQTFPWGGGAYFRLAPSSLFRRGIKSILKTDGAYLFYLHPWECDPKQPRENQASYNFKFRHYTNLHKTETKLEGLITKFKYCRFVTCQQYLSIIA